MGMRQMHSYRAEGYLRIGRISLVLLLLTHCLRYRDIHPHDDPGIFS
jgi:hypothetical protein